MSNPHREVPLDAIERMLSILNPLCLNGPDARTVTIATPVASELEAASLMTLAHVVNMMARVGTEDKPQRDLTLLPSHKDASYDATKGEARFTFDLSKIPGYRDANTNEQRAAILTHNFLVPLQRIYDSRIQQEEQDRIENEQARSERIAHRAQKKALDEAKKRQEQEAIKTAIERREAEEALKPTPYDLPIAQAAGLKTLQGGSSNIAKAAAAELLADAITTVAEGVNTKVECQRKLAEILLDDSALFAAAQSMDIGKMYAGARYTDLITPNARWVAQEEKRDRCGHAVEFLSDHPEATVKLKELAMEAPGLPLLLAAATFKKVEDIKAAAATLRENMAGYSLSEYNALAEGDPEPPHVMQLVAQLNNIGRGK